MNAPYKAGIFATGLSLAMLLPGAGSSISAGPAPAAESGTTTNYGWRIVWDAESARVVHVETGREIELYRDEKGATEEDGYVNHEMLSVVGPVISYSVNWYSGGGAHPSYGTGYQTVDISKLDPAGDKDGRIRLPDANLAKLFGEEAVFRQLAANPSVRAAIRGEFSDIGGAAHRDPQSLDELLKAAVGGCRANMGESLLTDFAFLYRLGRRTAVVQIGLSHGCEVNRGTFTELRPLYLRIPDALVEGFQNALESGLVEYRPFETPSFDCEKAGAPMEYALCTDARLASLDRSMGTWYGKLRQTLVGEEKTRLRKDQRAWIKARNAECLDAAADCLRDSYIGRLRDMEFPYMQELESQ
jgi:uncharacterized protein YecT (DUF1311 family)